ncbi:MAG: DUF4831 family protein [Tenuifilaceae bacterium]
MNKKNTLIIIVVFTLSCSKKPIQVNSAEMLTSLNTKGLIYALPRSVLKIKVEAAKQTIVPGPFGLYALKYLGISDAPTKKLEEWKISNIDVLTYIESDPTNLYAATPGDGTKVDFLKICSTGLIIPINGLNVNSNLLKDIPKRDYDGAVYFSDLSTKPFIATEKTSYVSRVQKDSVFVRVPVQKDIVVEKNLEEKARDAADFIFSLRKRRSDFLSVDADHNLNGEGLKIALDEINRLESEYLTLFIGKSFTEYSLNTFDYLPSQPEGESSIIFRFSASKGILASSDLSGNPILVKIEPEKVPSSYELLFNSISQEKDKPLTDVVYYRIPLSTAIKVTDGKYEFLNHRSVVYQYGPLVRMPIKFLIKDSVFIEF